MDDTGSHFPAIEGKTYSNIRMSWCYGEIGTCLSLLEFADTFNDLEVKELALKVLKKNALKRNKRILEYDAGICHGTSGLVMIFRSLFNRFGSVEFKESYEHWYLETLKLKKNKSIDVKQYEYYFGEKRGFENSNELLTGFCGTDLVMFSTENKTDQNWDKIFLL